MPTFFQEIASLFGLNEPARQQQQSRPNPIEKKSKQNNSITHFFEMGYKALRYIDPSSTRVALRNIYIKDKTLFGCDGHRALIAKVDVPFDDVVIPASLFKNVKHATVSSIKLSQDRKYLLINGQKYPEPIVTEAYPDMTACIPKSFTHLMQLSRQQLMTAVHAALAQAEEKKHGLVFKFRNGRLSITPMSAKNGHVVPQTIAVFCKSSFEDFGLDGKYLLRILQDTNGDSIRIKKNGSLQALVIEGEDETRFLLMPLRVTEHQQHYSQVA
ncbi:MAG: hypothetical protein JNL74_23275 [Fibrobacteres bacterium]|nr:hypothetical protein [Fibrobacterota bacterium]